MERFFAQIFSRFGELGAIIEIGRPWQAILIGLFPILGISLVNPALGFSSIIIFLAFFFAWLAGSTLNDLYDENVDKINMPYRPLERRQISRSTAWTFSILTHMIALLLAFSLGFKILLLMILFFIFSTFYSVPPIQFSHRGIFAQIELIFTVLVIPIYAGVVYTIGSFLINVKYLVVIQSLFLLFIFAFIVKDFKDITGDKKGHKFTAVLQFGKQNARLISLLGTISSFILFIFTIFHAVNFNLPLLFIWVVLLITILYSEYTVLKDPERSFALLRIFSLLFVLTIILSTNL